MASNSATDSNNVQVYNNVEAYNNGQDSSRDKDLNSVGELNNEEEGRNAGGFNARTSNRITASSRTMNSRVQGVRFNRLKGLRWLDEEGCEEGAEVNIFQSCHLVHGSLWFTPPDRVEPNVPPVKTQAIFSICCYLQQHKNHLRKFQLSSHHGYETHSGYQSVSYEPTQLIGSVLGRLPCSSGYRTLEIDVENTCKQLISLDLQISASLLRQCRSNHSGEFQCNLLFYTSNHFIV